MVSNQISNSSTLVHWYRISHHVFDLVSNWTSNTPLHSRIHKGENWCDFENRSKFRSRGTSHRWLRTSHQLFDPASFWVQKAHFKSEIWIFGPKSGPNPKSNAISVISDPQNLHFDTSINFGRQINFAHFQSEIGIPELKSRLHQNSDTIFVTNDPEHSYFDTFLRNSQAGSSCGLLRGVTWIETGPCHLKIFVCPVSIRLRNKK